MESFFKGNKHIDCIVKTVKGMRLTVGRDRWRELPMTSELLSRDRDSNSALLPETHQTITHCTEVK